MTTVELCEAAGLSRCTVNNWLEAGLAAGAKGTQNPPNLKGSGRRAQQAKGNRRRWIGAEYVLLP
jgi:hypothetical protein